MQVIVNGEAQELERGLTVRGLLDRLGVEPRRVVVEVNLEIVKRDRLDQVNLHAGDRVEIVQFVGGG